MSGGVRGAIAASCALVLVVLAGCSGGAGPRDARTRPSLASTAPVRKWLAHRPLWVAHRGGDADWPEASRLAYQQAAVWSPSLALEVPVRRTSDGVWVVSEDRSTGRVFGRDLVIALTPWATLATLRSLHGGQPMARLREDVLDVVARDRILFVDDKSDVRPGELLDLLDRYGGPQRTVIKAYWASRRMPAEAHRHGYLVWGYYDASSLAGFGSTQPGFDLLGLNWSAPRAVFARFEGTGKPVIAHVVARPTQARQALDSGAAGLMVSDVVRLVPRGV
jgi:glycerophosphoryl diester phosphodiesterase